MSKTEKIEKSKVILAEGSDAYWFLRHALGAYKIAEVQVFDFRGITELARYLGTFKLMDGFDDVESMIIARDAETDASAAIDSIKNSLKKENLPIPDEPYRFESGVPKVAFMLFPGYEDIASAKNMKNGTLEDLCLETLSGEIIYDEAQKYIETISTKHTKIKSIHKSTLHAYLAATNKFVGMKIGEAAKAGAWDWNSPSFSPLKKLLNEM